MIAGLAGALLAHHDEVIVGSKFGFQLALLFVLMTVVGGLRSRSGVVIGAAFFALLGSGKLLEMIDKPLGVFGFSLTEFIEGTIGLPQEFVALVVGPILLLLTITLYPGGIGQQIAPVRQWLLGRPLRPARRQGRGGDGHRCPCLRSATCPSTSAASRRCSTSTCAPASGRSSASSARTAPARRRCSTASPASTRPPSGSVPYRGRDISRLPVHRRTALGIGRTFQNVGLVKNATVAGEPAHRPAPPGRATTPLAGVLGRARRRSPRSAGSPSAVEQILELLELADGRRRPGSPTSRTALLKRVEIAAVLATDPDLLLLDEPGSGMGPEEAHALGDLLLEMRREFALTIVMIDHHVPLVTRVSDYVYCLNFGEVLAAGPPDVVRAHPEVVRAYMGEDDASTRRDRYPGGAGLMALLEVRDLVVGYGRFPVLHGIDFVVEEGEVCVLLGLNGAGKTTTVSTIAGLLRPTSGKVAFDGKSLGRKSPSARVKAGHLAVPRGAPGLPAAHRRRRTSGSAPGPGAAARATVRSQLELVLDYFPRLDERADQVAGTLSGGEQQMLAVGRALMSSPRLLMIDEASMGLSPTLARTVWEATARIARDGTTVLMVEQNAGALPFADRALIMEKGTLVHHAVGEDIRNVNLREAYLGA